MKIGLIPILKRIVELEGTFLKFWDYTLKRDIKIMAALDDIKAAEASIDKSIADIAQYLNTLAGSVTGGVSAAEAEVLATELKAKAASLEALIPPSVPPVV